MIGRGAKPRGHWSVRISRFAEYAWRAPCGEDENLGVDASVFQVRNTWPVMYRLYIENVRHVQARMGRNRGREEHVRIVLFRCGRDFMNVTSRANSAWPYVI